jgi:geranylgeranyl diphosphate synthase type I
MIRYQLESRGKRIRPALVFGVHRALGGSDEAAIPFAAAVELIHNASLVHDDIQDQDEERRGRPSAWKRFSINQAINLGDILFALAFEVFDRSAFPPEIKLEVVKLSIRTVCELVNGQVLELMYRRKGEITLDEYFTMVDGKTSSLFRLASRGAQALRANGTDVWRDDFASLGSCLGNMFQLRDDIIDLFGMKEGRRAGSDILEGKVSVLTSLSLARLDAGDRRELIGILQVPRDRKTDDVIGRVTDIYQRADAVRGACELYARERDKLFGLPVMRENRQLHGFMAQLVEQVSAPLDRIGGGAAAAAV